jgi:hypothetical protein
MRSKFPVLNHYQRAWPIHEIMKQFLGTQKLNFKKDTEAEINDTEEPDRDAIESYLNSLPSQKKETQGSDDDQEQEAEDEDEDEDEEGAERDSEGEEDEDEEEEDEDEDEVSDHGLDSLVKKNRRKTASASRSSKSRFLSDKTTSINNLKTGLHSTKKPVKTQRSLNEKKTFEKENFKLGSRAGKETGASSLMVETAANPSKKKVYIYHRSSISKLCHYVFPRNVRLSMTSTMKQCLWPKKRGHRLIIQF